MIWDNFEAKWGEAYQVAKLYFREHGDLLVPQSCFYNGVYLEKWLNRQRRVCKEGKMSAECIAMLNAIGMRW